MGRPLWKRICRKKGEHVWIIRKQPPLRPQNKRIVAPGSQRGEPQVPIESWLIRRVNAGRLVQILWLVTKRIRNPRLAVFGALKFAFLSGPRPYPHEPINSNESEWVEDRH